MCHEQMNKFVARQLDTELCALKGISCEAGDVSWQLMVGFNRLTIKHGGWPEMAMFTSGIQPLRPTAKNCTSTNRNMSFLGGLGWPTVQVDARLAQQLRRRPRICDSVTDMLETSRFMSGMTKHQQEVLLFAVPSHAAAIVIMVLEHVQEKYEVWSANSSYCN